ncbi:MAG: hypothetical protein ACU84Q_22270 [Gammaproteobacteria bacterium]
MTSSRMARTGVDCTDYHPMSQAVQEDPYPFYEHLRKHEPVKHIEDLNGYAVSRHADVRELLLNHKLGSQAFWGFYNHKFV